MALVDQPLGMFRRVFDFPPCRIPPSLTIGGVLTMVIQRSERSSAALEW